MTPPATLLTDEQRSFIEQAHEISRLDIARRHLPADALIRSGEWETCPSRDTLRRTPRGREKWWRRQIGRDVDLVAKGNALGCWIKKYCKGAA